MDVQPFLFWLIGGATAASAVAVVVTQNIVRAATWLLFTLAGVSGIFFLLGADLVGATQLLVYVGGTLVLVVFGVMLTAQGPFITMRTSAAEWAVSAVAGLLLFGVLAVGARQMEEEPSPPSTSRAKKFAPKVNLSKDPAQSQYTEVIGEGLLGVGVGPAHADPRRKSESIRVHYLLPFEIVSVHLLVVLIGAAYLARAKRRRRTA